jgi:hypothetical protein
VSLPYGRLKRSTTADDKSNSRTLRPLSHRPVIREPDMPPLSSTTYAWCFDHGTLHRLLAPEKPWCTAAWVPLHATSEEEAMEAKQHAYGDARFLDELPRDKQLEVIEAPQDVDIDA